MGIFGFSEQDLENQIENYSELSDGQKVLLLENFKQVVAERVVDDAELKRNGEFDEFKAKKEKFWQLENDLSDTWEHQKVLWGNMKKNVLKNFRTANLEKEELGNMSSGGIGRHKDFLNQLVYGMNEFGPDVEIGKDGNIEVQFMDIPDGLVEGDVEKVKNFNSVAYEYSRIPYEWSLPEADQKNRERFNEAREKYFEAHKEVLNVMSDIDGDQEAALHVNKIDRMVEFNQFLSSNPEVEERLSKIKDQETWKKALKDMASEKGIYLGLGFVTRTVTTHLLGAVALPFVAAGLGRTFARDRAEKELITSAKDARKDVNSVEKGIRAGEIMREISRVRADITELIGEIKNVHSWGFDHSETEKLREKLNLELSNKKSELKKLEKEEQEKFLREKDYVDAAYLNASFDTLIEDLQIVDLNESAKEEMIKSLNFHIEDAERKRKDGTVNFGTGANRLANQISLLQRLGKAKAFVAEREIETKINDKEFINKMEELKKKIVELDAKYGKIENSPENLEKRETELKNFKEENNISDYEESLEVVYDFLEAQDEGLDKAKEKHINKKGRQGAAIASGFAIGGYLIRAAGEELGYWKARPLFKTSEAQASDLGMGNFKEDIELSELKKELTSEDFEKIKSLARKTLNKVGTTDATEKYLKNICGDSESNRAYISEVVSEVYIESSAPGSEEVSSATDAVASKAATVGEQSKVVKPVGVTADEGKKVVAETAKKASVPANEEKPNIHKRINTLQKELGVDEQTLNEADKENENLQPETFNISSENNEADILKNPLIAEILANSKKGELTAEDMERLMKRFSPLELAEKIKEIKLQAKSGDSVWTMADKFLNEKYGADFDNLGEGDVKAAEALKTYNIDRLKDKIAEVIKSQDSELMKKYGLEGIKDIDRVTINQLEKINFSQIDQDVFDLNEGLTDELDSSQIDSIVDNNEKLRTVFKDNPASLKTSEDYENVLNPKPDIPQESVGDSSLEDISSGDDDLDNLTSQFGGHETTNIGGEAAVVTSSEGQEIISQMDKEFDSMSSSNQADFLGSLAEKWHAGGDGSERAKLAWQHYMEKLVEDKDNVSDFKQWSEIESRVKSFETDSLKEVEKKVTNLYGKRFLFVGDRGYNFERGWPSLAQSDAFKVLKGDFGHELIGASDATESGLVKYANEIKELIGSPNPKETIGQYLSRGELEKMLTHEPNLKNNLSEIKEKLKIDEIFNGKQVFKTGVVTEAIVGGMEDSSVASTEQVESVVPGIHEEASQPGFEKVIDPVPGTRVENFEVKNLKIGDSFEHVLRGTRDAVISEIRDNGTIQLKTDDGTIIELKPTTEEGIYDYDNGGTELSDGALDISDGKLNYSLNYSNIDREAVLFSKFLSEDLQEKIQSTPPEERSFPFYKEIRNAIHSIERLSVSGNEGEIKIDLIDRGGVSVSKVLKIPEGIKISEAAIYKGQLDNNTVDVFYNDTRVASLDLAVDNKKDIIIGDGLFINEKLEDYLLKIVSRK